MAKRFEGGSVGGSWASFYERDHFGDPRLPLRERLTLDAQAHGISLPEGPIFLLTHLRYLGYCFNPISLFFCYGQTGALDGVCAEVNSTFGETRNYWLGPQNQQPAANSLRYRCPKEMHVSPFMGMDLDYEFVLTEPSGALFTHINTSERSPAEGSPAHLFDATLTLDHKPWGTPHVTRSLIRHPWMTAKVIAAIHWQAFRLFLKKVPLFPHPAIQEASKGS